MTTEPTIHVTGDAYTALFFVPRRSIFLDGVNADHWHVHSMPVGVEYIFRAIRAACDPELLGKATGGDPENVRLSRREEGVPFNPRSSPKRDALYEITNVAEISELESTQRIPLLRSAQSESQSVHVHGISTGGENAGDDHPPKTIDVLVHWFGEMADKNHPRCTKAAAAKIERRPCAFHLQVGLATPLGGALPRGRGAAAVAPASVATPTAARLIVVNIGEISSAHRIRRTLSYEAAAVDLLRHLRGDAKQAKPAKELEEMSMAGKDAAPLSVLAVRINNSAVFLYACARVKAGREKFEEIGAWLLCHKTESAPLSQPELGQMVGFTGFVSAHLAASLACWIRQHGTGPVNAATPVADREEPYATFCDAIMQSVRRSLSWQHVAYERGCLHMLWERKSNTWKPILPSSLQRTERIGYDYLFAEIVKGLKKQFAKKQETAAKAKPGKPKAPSATPSTSPEPPAVYDSLFEEEVLCVKVDICRAVAHRTQWFMARSVAMGWEDGRVMKPEKPPSSTVPGQARPSGAPEPEIDLEKTFRKIAIGWLSSIGNQSVTVPGKSPAIPIIRIGDADLMDRREVEDFLAIQHALQVYADSPHEKIPLNIAVFGAPGSGKSYAVKQVVKRLGDARKGVFKKEALTFNLSQFKSLDDLPSALHLVRNECLSGEIPIVFFDEFDSTFNGQPFGWFKFFLAPMQDANFYDAGQTYKMGRAVFVFAGGVNRSFEELNGRVRNPSFCEAKGPDFISRLKAHLNVQGINKPEEDADQARYVLRRGILLRDIVRRKLGIRAEVQDAHLLHGCVAAALLQVDRFKHGVRSLEAIIKTCSTRVGFPIGPSDLPSMDQLEMHVDAAKLLKLVDKYSRNVELAFLPDA